ncbi:MAG: DNA alkylation repair protein [bacterium]
MLVLTDIHMKKIINFHQEIVAEFKKHSGQGTEHSWNSSYLGHTHFTYNTSNPIKRKIAKEFVKKHKDISNKEFKSLLDALYTSPSYDEKSFASMLLEYMKDMRKSLRPKALDSWLNHLHGWAEVDSLCQSNFKAEEMLENWDTWNELITKFSTSKNISKRRASLVLLTGAISHNNDNRLFKLGMKNIEKLKTEKDILITKAISWLLRSMVKHHKKAVALYLKQNLDSLPKIAIRETERKILTGRK